MNIADNLLKIMANLNKLAAVHDRDGQLFPVCERLNRQLSTLAQLAPRFDYDRVECNGYRQALHFASLLTELASEVDQYLVVLEFISWNLDFVLKCSHNDHNALSVDDYFRFLGEYCLKRDALDIIVRSGKVSLSQLALTHTFRSVSGTQVRRIRQPVTSLRDASDRIAQVGLAVVAAALHVLCLLSPRGMSCRG